MKILWVKAGDLVPPDTGGRIRSYNILRELARYHDVTLFLFYGVHPNDEHQALEMIFQRVICVPLDLPAKRSLREFLNYAANLFSRDPYNLKKYCKPEVRKQLEDVIENNNFDVIVCDFLVPAGVIPWKQPGPKVIFTHNVEAVIWKRHYEVARNPFWKALSWYEWKRMQGAEQRYLKKVGHVFVVSENDRDTLRRFLDTTKITVIQTGTDVEYFQPSTEEEDHNSLVFVGSMDWMPNGDAMDYFVSSILPLIREHVPEVSLRIVGRKPSVKLRALAIGHECVEVTGLVQDVRPYMARSAVCIVPLRIGGGTRLKIFEAMAMGKAVVSTSIGAEGLPIRHGENILLADTPSTFANHVIALLRDPAKRRAIGNAARELVADNYGWAAIAKDFTTALKDVVTHTG